ncbi:intermembrane transport protein PqiB [Motilimonas eburnea]|uniref:intermembrane transport protein PqiB n=1 Tax=Motilimonas eburnea TaxID=1737488 RepID=UPI001E43584A|nr:intermembrane transport protein PqiB [Motilimonas eburnea]MCE2573689.1 intermembrane transport protein PqiB [Motilimonas eburnea]
MATKESNTSISKVWLVPLIALLIGGWMIYQHMSSQGPLITLEITDADGLAAGKTKVKALSVDVGLVESIELNDTYDKAILKVRINNSAAKMLVADSEFWVVKPRIGKDGVSGLGTLLSGAYLELKPGSSELSEDNYKVLDLPPLISSDTPGLRLKLSNRSTKAVSAGAPINFRGFEVGRIETVRYDIESRKTEYGIFIFAPYDALVTTNTRFWIKPGMSLDLTAKGLNFELDSLESLLNGGVTFGVPKGWKAGDAVAENDEFHLFSSHSAILNNSYQNFLEFVLLFDQSIAGLSAGAPVEFRGVQIGRVRQAPYLDPTINAEYNFSGLIPVLIRLEFDRWHSPEDKRPLAFWRKNLDKMLANGLKARLKSGNLLTGAKLVDLTVQPDSIPSPAQAEWAARYDVTIIPTIKGGFDELEQKVSMLLDKINALNIETTINNANQLLKTTESSMKSLDTIMSNDDLQGLPAELSQTLAQTNETLRSYSRDSQIHKDLTQTVRTLEQSLRELQPFLRKISAKPNAIIFDGKTQRDPRLESR